MMVELLHDKDSGVRRQAVFCVPLVREALPGVIDLLKDADPRVRGNAKFKLAQMVGVVKPLPPEILELADDPDDQVRSELATNLRKGGSATIPLLLKLLEDKHAYVRAAAAESLGDLGPAAKETVVALQRHLADYHGADIHGDSRGLLVCHTVARALNRILGETTYVPGIGGIPPIPPDGK